MQHCDENEYSNGILFAHANFADKKLKLDFTKPGEQSNFVPRSLDATIDGNKFTGKTNDTTVNGAFYGDNAKDIAGHHANPTENFQCAFGGSQRCPPFSPDIAPKKKPDVRIRLF